ncbi:MAG: tyrosine-protein phosphatase [Clostridium sp.]|uniref:tyrosine-protein phosphatase n=2 Tax=Clostridium sp. TaxID=1506 RepID=UPI002FC7E49E
MGVFIVGIVVFLVGVLLFIRLGGVGVKPFSPVENTFIHKEDRVDERIVILDNIHNMRDIGKIQSRCGKKVSSGLIYRTDRLSFAGEDDLEKIKKLGIKTSVDLRENRAFETRPNKLPSNVKYIHIPIFEKVSNKVKWAMLFSRNSLDRIFSDDYIYQVEHCAKSYGRALEVISDYNNLPLMYNCTSGKDRTGILTALILMIIGIDEDAIVRDYSLSNYNYDNIYKAFEKNYGKRINKLCNSVGELGLVVGVNPKWMIRTIDYIKDNYGTIDYYLLSKAKLSSESIDKIRYNLLERDESF